MLVEDVEQLSRRTTLGIRNQDARYVAAAVTRRGVFYGEGCLCCAACRHGEGEQHSAAAVALSLSLSIGVPDVSPPSHRHSIRFHALSAIFQPLSRRKVIGPFKMPRQNLNFETDLVF